MREFPIFAKKSKIKVSISNENIWQVTMYLHEKMCIIYKMLMKFKVIFPNFLNFTGRKIILASASSSAKIVQVLNNSVQQGKFAKKYVACIHDYQALQRTKPCMSGRECVVKNSMYTLYSVDRVAKRRAHATHTKPCMSGRERVVKNSPCIVQTDCPVRVQQSQKHKNSQPLKKKHVCRNFKSCSFDDCTNPRKR